MEKDEQIYGIFVHEKPKNIFSEYDNHGRFVIHLVTRTEAGKIRNFSSSTWEKQEPLDLADLHLRTYYTVKKGEVSELYGWHIEYSPFAVDLPRAEKMVKTLRKIGKALEKIEADRGRAQNFAEYAQRFLKVVGAVGMLRQTDKRPGGWSYDDSTYQVTKLRDVATAILCEEAEAKEAVRTHYAA